MTLEPMKIAMDYAASSEILRTTLKLKGSPVALAFAATKEDIPPGMPEVDKTIRHCMMVSLARNEGKIFYATAEKHECNGGGWALGLKELTPTLKNGTFYFKLGKFASKPASERTMNNIPHLRTGETYATMYAPLEKTSFTPQVVLIIANPSGSPPCSGWAAGHMQSSRVSNRSVPMHAPRPSSPGSRTSPSGAMARESSPALPMTRWSWDSPRNSCRRSRMP
jgi:hypothetical protein